MLPEDAVTAPRFATAHHEDSFDPNPNRAQTFGQAGSLTINDSVSENVREELGSRGHQLRVQGRCDCRTFHDLILTKTTWNVLRCRGPGLLEGTRQEWSKRKHSINSLLLPNATNWCCNALKNLRKDLSLCSMCWRFMALTRSAVRSIPPKSGITPASRNRLQQKTFVPITVAFPIRNRAVPAKHLLERLRIEKQPPLNMRFRNHADDAIHQVRDCLIDLFFPLQKSFAIAICSYEDEIW